MYLKVRWQRREEHWQIPCFNKRHVVWKYFMGNHKCMLMGDANNQATDHTTFDCQINFTRNFDHLHHTRLPEPYDYHWQDRLCQIMVDLLWQRRDKRLSILWWIFLSLLLSDRYLEPCHAFCTVPTTNNLHILFLHGLLLAGIFWWHNGECDFNSTQ